MFSKKTMTGAILATVILAAVAGASPAAAQTEVEVEFGWTAPNTGSAVDHYVIEHSVNGGAWTQIATSATNTYTLTATVGDSHQLRVAGVDAQGRQGVYSNPSAPYVPDVGPPGQPGQPILM